MRAFAVLGLFFSTPSWEIGLGKLLRSDLFCVEWDVKPQLSHLASCCSGWYRCVLSDAAVVGVLMQEMPTVKASCQFLVSLLDFTLNFQKTSQVAEQNKKVKVAHSRLLSVGFQSWSRFLAVSLQVMWVINPTVGCHYWAECWSDYYMFNWNCPQCVVSCPVWLNLCYMRMARARVCVCVKSSLLSLTELPVVSQIVSQQGQSLVDALLRVSLCQGSQTHLSMWAAVEGNSQSAGPHHKMQLFYPTLFSLQLKAKIQYMYRQFSHAWAGKHRRC